MPWRVIQHDDRRWQVTVAAERRAHSSDYQLVLSFRPADTDQRAVWAAYPLSSPSKAALFAQADRLPDTALAEFLAERIG